MAYCHSNDVPSQPLRRNDRSKAVHFHAIQPNIQVSGRLFSCVQYAKMTEHWRNIHLIRNLNAAFIYLKKISATTFGLSASIGTNFKDSSIRTASTLKCAFAVKHKMLWALIPYVTSQRDCVHVIRMTRHAVTHNTHHK